MGVIVTNSGYSVTSQVVKMVQELGAITVRGNHDEIALERYQSWKLTGTLDVSPSLATIPLWNAPHSMSLDSLAGGKHGWC